MPFITANINLKKYYTVQDKYSIENNSNIQNDDIVDIATNQYKKFDIKKESFNSTHIKHPLITSEIGNSISSNFDDGLIRGGIVTAIKISNDDTNRISKWLISPAGLRFILKQKLLSFTNPKSDADNRLNNSKLINILPSVGSNAFGIHSPSNHINKYDKIYRGGKEQSINRLVSMLNKSLSRSITNINDIYLGGPNSVYGLGVTILKKSISGNKNTNFNKYGGSPLIPALLSPLHKTSKYYDFSKKINTAGIESEDEYINNLLFKISNPKIQIKSAVNTNNDPYFNNSKSSDINKYLTMSYDMIPDKNTTSKNIPNDFRNSLEERTKFTGIIDNNINKDYYKNNNLSTKYGFGNPSTEKNRKFIISGNSLAGSNGYILSKNKEFSGDKINAIDINTKYKITNNTPYQENITDLVNFYFEDIEYGRNMITFRASITGLSESFSANWNPITIIGRADTVAQYTGFNPRTLSFSFIVYAYSRSELIPIWRKLNYLVSYTMPVYDSTRRFAGPLMRFTYSDLYKRIPCYINNIDYSIDDEYNWDIADDISEGNIDALVVPMGVNINITLTLIGNDLYYNMGRIFDLNNSNTDWLSDAVKLKNKI